MRNQPACFHERPQNPKEIAKQITTVPTGGADRASHAPASLHCVTQI